MPAVSAISKEWVGDGIGMPTAALRKLKTNRDKGMGIRLQNGFGGVRRYASICRWKDGHERTLPGGVALSVVVSPSVSADGRLLNHVAKLGRQRGALFPSRTAAIHDSVPTVYALSISDIESGPLAGYTALGPSVPLDSLAR